VQSYRWKRRCSNRRRRYARACTSFAETAGALAEAVAAGKIRHVGVSNTDAGQMEEFSAGLLTHPGLRPSTGGGPGRTEPHLGEQASRRWRGPASSSRSAESAARAVTLRFNKSSAFEQARQEPVREWTCACQCDGRNIGPRPKSAGPVREGLG